MIKVDILSISFCKKEIIFLYLQPTPKQISIAISMGIILFIRRIVSIYAIINKPTSGFVAETEHFSPAGV